MAAGLVREDVLALGADTEGVNYASVYNGTTPHVISEGPRVHPVLCSRGELDWHTLRACRSYEEHAGGGGGTLGFSER